MNRDGATFGKHRSRPVTRKSIATYSVVGSLLLGLPLLFATFWPYVTCNAATEFFCSRSLLYKVGISALPYVMLVGGLIIGYNMKRVSDSLQAEEDARDSDDDNWSSPRSSHPD